MSMPPAIVAQDAHGRFAGTRGLTPQQAAFVAAYVANGGLRQPAALSAGYADPRTESYRLLQNPSVRAAIHDAQHRRLSHLATASIDLLGGVVLGTIDAPVKVRVDAAKTILDRAGHVAPKASDAAPTDDKPLETMTIAEMEAFIRRGEEAVRQARQPVLDGTAIVPDDSQPIETIETSAA